MENLLKTQDVGDLLGISRWTVVRLIRAGKIPAHLVGTRWRIKPIDVEEYVNRNRMKFEDVADA